MSGRITLPNDSSELLEVGHDFVPQRRGFRLMQTLQDAIKRATIVWEELQVDAVTRKRGLIIESSPPRGIEVGVGAEVAAERYQPLYTIRPRRQFKTGRP